MLITGSFSSWTGDGMNLFTVNRNDMSTKGMSFSIFSPAQGTSSSSSSDIIIIIYIIFINDSRGIQENIHS